MRLFVIAGEDSGDLHTAHLIHALRQRRPGWVFRGVGGDKMEAEGATLIAHVRDINFMGFLEVIRHLGRIRKLFASVKKEAKAWRPDAVLLIDYPGFNLPIARYFHRQRIPVYYYISPQVWAWKQGRVRDIRRYIQRLLVILPFEQAFFQGHGIEVDFVGHPLLDALANQPAPQPQPGRVALLPGSRAQEIRRMLPLMAAVATRFPHFDFEVAAAPSQPISLYQQLIGEAPISISTGGTYAVLASASAALVTSGTATLETALMNVPQAVCYKGSALSYAIGKRLVKVPFISLVNLILGRGLVSEYIQHAAHPDALAAALEELMTPNRQSEIRAGYAELRAKLGGPGASVRAASVLIQYLEPNSR